MYERVERVLPGNVWALAFRETCDGAWKCHAWVGCTVVVRDEFESEEAALAWAERMGQEVTEDAVEKA